MEKDAFCYHNGVVCELLAQPKSIWKLSLLLQLQFGATNGVEVTHCNFECEYIVC